MQNPIYRIFELERPFVYFHTHIITQEVLGRALNAKKSLEVDLSIADDGFFYVGHPVSFYKFRNQPPPNNLPLETVIKKVKEGGLYLVLDCKDYRALDKAREIIEEVGAKRCLLHGWVDKLLFKPYPKEITIEPHWQYEDLAFNDLLEIKCATNVPLIISSRGLTRMNLRDGKEEIMRRIIDVAKGNADVVNLNLPGNEAPPPDILQTLIDNNVLPFIALDVVPEENRPPIFVGMTDEIEQASSIQNFA